MPTGILNCCCTSSVHEAKILFVTAPWGAFFPPFTNASTHTYRYAVMTDVYTNETGTRTTIYYVDEDCGSTYNEVSTTPGFDSGSRTGSLLSQGATSETEYVRTWQYASQTQTLSSGVLMADQVAKAAAKLTALVNVVDAKDPTGITGWQDLGFGLEELTFAWVFASEIADYATLVPGSDYGQNVPLLKPDPSEYPWSGKYVIENGVTYDSWWFAQYGWIGPVNDLTFYISGDPSLPTGWQSNSAPVVCSLSCHHLPNGMGCGTANVQDVVIATTDQTAIQRVTSGPCGGLALDPGYYCFDWTGIYEPGNATPIAESWSEVTTPGWGVMTEEGNGNGALFVNWTGPCAWEVTCCP